jgi:hypothetical protein
MSPAKLKGFNYPLTPKGKSTLNPPPPWYYSSDFLDVEFWAQPAAVASLLPNGLEPDPAANGHGNALFSDWQFSGANEEYLDPARYQYREFFILVDALFEGRSVSYCPYIFVDNGPSALWQRHTRFHGIRRRRPEDAQGSQEVIRSTAAERDFALCEMSIFERLRNSMKTKPTAKEPCWDFCFWFAVSSPLLGVLLPWRFLAGDRRSHEHALSNLDLQCSCRSRLRGFGLFFGSPGARRLWPRHI